MHEEGLKQTVEIRIEIDDATANGVYANFASIYHTENEFVVDFIFLQPQEPKGKVRARIISSPGHTKRFLEALSENIKRYEEKFGEIKSLPPIDRRIGFLA